MYENEEITRPVKDLNKQREVDKNKSDAEKKQEFVNTLNARKLEYQDEYKVIEQAAAQFGCFLKYNAITPYNNATIEHLDHLIKEEKSKVHAGCEVAVLESLEQAKASIKEQIDAIDRTIGNHENLLMNPERVTSLAERLYKLKHFGASLKGLKEFTGNMVASNRKEVPFLPRKPTKLIGLPWRSIKQWASHF